MFAPLRRFLARFVSVEMAALLVGLAFLHLAGQIYMHIWLRLMPVSPLFAVASTSGFFFALIRLRRELVGHFDEAPAGE